MLSPGRSLAGVRLGDSPAAVRARWGTRYNLCQICGRRTWLYTYRRGNPVGAAVSFRDGHVSAVFTLGAPAGWRTTRGLVVGGAAERIRELYGRLASRGCIGYGALTMRTARTVTSICTSGEVVHGFALTLPSEPVCQ